MIALLGRSRGFPSKPDGLWVVDLLREGHTSSFEKA